MKGIPMPMHVPPKLLVLLNSMPVQETETKKKKKKKKVPKGFDKFGDDVTDGLYKNNKNGWYYALHTKLYFKQTEGPFFVFDVAQKKLVPASAS